jgi:hypothetical protein
MEELEYQYILFSVEDSVATITSTDLPDWPEG